MIEHEQNKLMRFKNILGKLDRSFNMHSHYGKGFENSYGRPESNVPVQGTKIVSQFCIKSNAGFHYSDIL